ncbi:uncharacterized protein LOC108608106 [Drosophila busckii]|uniref:uncharacterized protein LOC108608106 n=1 Tax=Drosophila busckii TaxID=30019 RepID=UPI00083EA76C|nr:uncharacterized protein LOC108608106 [Drosophila busckii]
MELPKLSIRNMESDYSYDIDDIYRADTQYGEKIIVISDDWQIYLPNRFNAMGDDDIDLINNNYFSLYKNMPESHWGGLAPLGFEYDGNFKAAKQLRNWLNSLSENYQPSVPIQFMECDFMYQINKIYPVASLYYAECRLAKSTDCYVHLPEVFNYLNNADIHKLSSGNFSIVKTYEYYGEEQMILIYHGKKNDYNIYLNDCNVHKLRNILKKFR